MNIVFAGSITACLALILIMILLLRRSVAGVASLPVTTAWIDELSTEQYRPMMRLLSQRDVAFLRSQPGFSPRMIRRLQDQRARIFREYLESLNADFRRVCAGIKLVMLQSREDRPDLAETLIRQQVVFTVAMIHARVRLALYRAGIGGVDITQLVRIFDDMRLELRSLTPAMAASAA